MAVATSLASTITIEEIGGSRRLELRGAALPLQGTEWGTAQRLVTKWYVGNTIEATQQIFYNGM